MNRSLLIAGGTQYVREYAQNGAYYVSKEFYLKKLYRNYEVDNLSKKNLNAKNAYLLIFAFTNAYHYDEVLISLGEADAKANTPLKDFREYLVKIVELLLEKNIHPVLQCYSEKEDIKGYQRVIKEIRNEYGLYSYLHPIVENKKAPESF